MITPFRRKLPVVLVLSVAVDGDDADGRAGRVGDDNGLGRITAVVRYRRGRLLGGRGSAR